MCSLQTKFGNMYLCVGTAKWHEFWQIKRYIYIYIYIYIHIHSLKESRRRICLSKSLPNSRNVAAQSFDRNPGQTHGKSRKVAAQSFDRSPGQTQGKSPPNLLIEIPAKLKESRRPIFWSKSWPNSRKVAAQFVDRNPGQTQDDKIEAPTD